MWCSSSKKKFLDDGDIQTVQKFLIGILYDI